LPHPRLLIIPISRISAGQARFSACHHQAPGVTLHKFRCSITIGLIPSRFTLNSGALPSTPWRSCQGPRTRSGYSTWRPCHAGAARDRGSRPNGHQREHHNCRSGCARRSLTSVERLRGQDRQVAPLGRNRTRVERPPSCSPVGPALGARQK